MLPRQYDDVASMLIAYWQHTPSLAHQTRELCRQLTTVLLPYMPADLSNKIRQSSHPDKEYVRAVVVAAAEQSLTVRDVVHRLAKPSVGSQQQVSVAGDNAQVVTVGRDFSGSLSMQSGTNTSFERTKANSVASTISILFVSADPSNAPRLRLGEEMREIQEELQLAKLREQFIFHQRMSVRPEDLSRALLATQPQVVHFSGHGTTTGELCFEDRVGNIHPVPADALSALFEQFSNIVQCTLLNACFSEAQGKAIAQHIPDVVGMNQAVSDEAAIAFTIGFYQALGAGRSFKDAYNFGRVQMRLQGVPEHLTPVLISRS